MGENILDSWQAKILLHSDGKLWKICLSVIAHSHDRSMLRLLEALFPGFVSIDAPFLCSAAKIAKTGHVCADVCTRDGKIIRMFVIFRTTKNMEAAFRRLADKAKLNDADRIDMFEAAKRWVVSDFRLDPNMDARDPDAKRLVVN